MYFAVPTASSAIIAKEDPYGARYIVKGVVDDPAPGIFTILLAVMGIELRELLIQSPYIDPMVLVTPGVPFRTERLFPSLSFTTTLDIHSLLFPTAGIFVGLMRTYRAPTVPSPQEYLAGVEGFLPFVSFGTTLPMHSCPLAVEVTSGQGW
jgi:hypothetical protein